MEKDLAVKVATAYCEAAGLSVDKFLAQTSGIGYYDYTVDFVRYPPHAKKMGIGEGPEGEPILHVNADLSVEETEFTRKYLSKD